MHSPRSAIHLRARDHAAAGLVDLWISRHGVAAHAFDDPLAACVFAVQCLKRLVDLAFLGLDGFDAADVAALEARVRERWTGLTVIAYAGTSRGTAQPALGDFCCESFTHLKHLLAGTPAQLVATRRDPNAANGDQVQTGFNPAPKTATLHVDRVGSDSGWVDAATAQTAAPGRHGRAILTRDEWRALLTDARD